MKPRFHVILATCIELGVEVGIRRAFKHKDDPSHAEMVTAIERAIWEQLDEWFTFPEDNNDANHPD